MDEQMRDVKLSPDEIKDLMGALEPDHNGRDFESECPSCTAYAKLSAALSQPAAQGDSDHSAGGECGGVQVRKRGDFVIPRQLAYRTWAFLAQDCTPCAMADCQIDGKNTGVDTLVAEWATVTNGNLTP